MMPQITVSDSTMAMLKDLADPFVDTTAEAVILKALQVYKKNKEWHVGPTVPATPKADNNQLAFPVDAPPDLKFTRPVEITLDDKKFGKGELYWNALLFEIVRRAATKLAPDQLRKSILVNFVDGKGDESTGYRYIPDAGLSVQGQASNPAWKGILHLTKTTGMKLDVTFLWENKDKSAHPGKLGRMVYEPV